MPPDAMSDALLTFAIAVTWATRNRVWVSHHIMTKTEKKFVKIEKGEKVEILEIEPFQHNSPEYKCCFHKVHFKRAAAGIAILTIILALFSITISAIAKFWWTIIPAVIALVLACLILYAHKSEKQTFYLPYVVFNMVLIVSAICFVILGIVLIIFVPKWSQNFVQNVEGVRFSDSQQKIDATRVFMAVSLAILLAFIAIGTWFVYVVYKAFMYMRDMHLARHPYKFLYTNGIKNGLENTSSRPTSPRIGHANAGFKEKY
uniref:Uncharacterized protein n=1 Tax=Panagrellus redivivus TaxID=6233 RepID=A0A7E4VKL9_PANRE